MIDKAIYSQLVGCQELLSSLTTYAGKPAVFNQEAPPDSDPLWADGAQYGRVVFALDVLGDPARAIGGTLSVDAFCKTGEQAPEELEPILRALIDGVFFTDDGCTMAAQWVDSRYFTPPTDAVSGVSLSFSLLAFPLLSTDSPDVIARLNAWTASVFSGLSVLNYDTLPSIWKADADTAAIYWRVSEIRPAKWIPDTHQTIWRTALVHGHIFAHTLPAASELAAAVVYQLYRARRLVKTGESQILVGENNSVNATADALRTGQISVDATYGQIVRWAKENPLKNLHLG